MELDKSQLEFIADIKKQILMAQPGVKPSLGSNCMNTWHKKRI